MPTRTKFLIGLSFLIIFVLVTSGLTTIYQVLANPTPCPPSNPNENLEKCGLGDAFVIAAAIVMLVACLPFLLVLMTLYFKNKIFSRIIIIAFLLITLWCAFHAIYALLLPVVYFPLNIIFTICLLTLAAYYLLLLNKRTLRYANFL